MSSRSSVVMVANSSHRQITVCALHHLRCCCVAVSQCWLGSRCCRVAVLAAAISTGDITSLMVRAHHHSHTPFMVHPRTSLGVDVPYSQFLLCHRSDTVCVCVCLCVCFNQPVRHSQAHFTVACHCRLIHILALLDASLLADERANKRAFDGNRGERVRMRTLEGKPEGQPSSQLDQQQQHH